MEQINLAEKEVNLFDEIDIYHDNISSNVTNNEVFKDRLMANLYSTVEHLKEELSEKNVIIRKLLEEITRINSCNIYHTDAMRKKIEETRYTSLNSTLIDSSCISLVNSNETFNNCSLDNSTNDNNTYLDKSENSHYERISITNASTNDNNHLITVGEINKFGELC